MVIEMSDLVQRLISFLIYFLAVFFSMSFIIFSVFSERIAFIILLFFSLGAGISIEKYTNLFTDGLKC